MKFKVIATPRVRLRKAAPKQYAQAFLNKVRVHPYYAQAEKYLRTLGFSEERMAHYHHTAEKMALMLISLEDYQNFQEFDKAMVYIVAALLHTKDPIKQRNVEHLRQIGLLELGNPADQKRLADIVENYHKNYERMELILKPTKVARSEKVIAEAIKAYLLNSIVEMEELFLYFADVLDLVEKYSEVAPAKGKLDQDFREMMFVGEHDLPYVQAIADLAAGFGKDDRAGKGHDYLPFDNIAKDIYTYLFQIKQSAFHEKIRAHIQERFGQDFLEMEDDLFRRKIEVEAMLDELGIARENCRIEYRVKQAKSIAEKANLDEAELEEINDYRGIRVVFKNEQDMLRYFNAFIDKTGVTASDLKNPKNKDKEKAVRICGGKAPSRDPLFKALGPFYANVEVKMNGFKDIHVNYDGVEYQLRTEAWHYEAEHGEASHKKVYKPSTDFSADDARTAREMLKKERAKYQGKIIVGINGQPYAVPYVDKGKGPMTIPILDLVMRYWIKSENQYPVSQDGKPINWAKPIQMGENVLIKSQGTKSLLDFMRSIPLPLKEKIDQLKSTEVYRDKPMGLYRAYHNSGRRLNVCAGGVEVNKFLRFLDRVYKSPPGKNITPDDLFFALGAKLISKSDVEALIKAFKKS